MVDWLSHRVEGIVGRCSSRRHGSDLELTAYPVISR